MVNEERTDRGDRRIAIRGRGRRKHRSSRKLVVSGLVDLHQHVDKSRTRRIVRIRPARSMQALAGYQAFAAGVTHDDMIARATCTRNLPRLRNGLPSEVTPTSIRKRNFAA